MIARGAPLAATLDALLQVVEAQSPEMLTSILLLDADGVHLHHGAAPRLPADYVRAIDGVAIGPEIGSCGTAAWRREAVIVADIATDPLWDAFKELALAHGLRACWSTPIFDADGRVLGTFALYFRQPGQPTAAQRQIIEIATHTAAICISRHRAEQALRASEARARAIADNSPVGIFMCDPAGNNIYTNRAIHEQLGVIGDSTFGLRWVESVHPADRERVMAAWQAYLAQTTLGYELEVRIVRPSGEERVVHTSAVPLREGSRLLGHVGNSVDITERKRAEAILHEREARLRAIIATDPECLKLVSVDCHLLEMNPAGLAMLEAASLAEAQAKPLLDYVLPAHHAAFAELHEKVMRGESGVLEFEVEGLRGTRRWLETHATPMRDQTGGISAILCITRDVTQRRRAEATLRESEERFRQVVENIREAFWMSDARDGGMIYVSPRFTELWGRSAEALCRAPGASLEGVHPDDRARVKAALPGMISGNYDETHRVVRPDGTVRWVRARAFPVSDAKGKPYRIVGVAEDITEKREMEIELMRAHRVESVGRLANGIAHDMNNTLAPIMMSASLLKIGLPPAETARVVEAIESSAKRGSDLVRQLLVFSRGVEGEAVPIRPADLIDGVAEMVRQTFPRNIEIATSVPAGAWSIRGDATQLHQVVLNLCLNARDAMPGGGRLGLSAENVSLDANSAATSPKAQPGPYVVLRVTDNGLGISPEIAGKIFDPFFTTKEVGRGTGLGLSTASGIVENHRGFIRMQSEVGKGTRFDLYLPAIRESKEAPAAPPKPASPPKPVLIRGRGELVLLVDDEENIRRSLDHVLSHHGYRVLLAKDGMEACEIFARHPEIALVITDLDMPVMDGVALAHAVRKLHRTVKIVVSTGLSAGRNAVDRTPELEALGVDAILLKPYGAAKVLALVREVLDRT